MPKETITFKLLLTPHIGISTIWSHICKADSVGTMYKVYLLQSLRDKKKSYVGLTIKDIEIRLKEHNNGLSIYTKTHLPWKLIYFENFYCRVCAEKREQFLKSGFGHRFKKLILDNYKNLN